MLATLAFALVLGRPAQEPTTPKVDSGAILDQLIERSREVKSFSATYRLSRSDESKSARLRFDYRAPDQLRMDAEGEGTGISTWSLAEVLVMRGEKDGKPSGMRIDSRPIYAELQPIVDEVERVFPVANSPFARRASALLMSWSVNPSTKVFDYDLTVGTFDGVQSPFGWLTTLRSKHVDFVEDGEYLRCSTDDGRVDVVISRTTGILEQFVGRKSDSPVAMTIELESLAIDQPIDAARFEVPPFAEDERAAAQNVKQMARTAQGSIRDELWRRAANACTSVTVEPELRSRFEATMRPLHELMCHGQYEDWIAKTRKYMNEIAEYVRQMDEAGSSDEELAQIRDKYRSELVDALDKTGDPSRAKFEIPARAATAGCAPQLLEVERALAINVFRDLVRQPLLDEFDRATKTD